MYIHPFVAGVLATLGLEMVLFLWAALRCGSNTDDE